MKRFFRSFSGKVFLYLSFLISLTLFVLSLAGGFAYNENKLYLSSKENVLDSLIKNEVRDRAYQIVWTLMEDNNPEQIEEYLQSCTFTNRENEEILYHMEAQNKEKEIRKLDYYYNRYVDEQNGNEIVPTGREGQYHLELEIGKSYVDSLLETKWPEVLAIRLLFDYHRYLDLLTGISLLFCVILFVTLMQVAGRRETDEEIHESVFFKIPFDLLAAGCGFIVVTLIYILIESRRSSLYIIATAVVGWLVAALAVGVCMDFSARWKKNCLVSTTLSLRILSFVWETGKKILAGFLNFVKGLFQLFADLPLVSRLLSVLAIEVAAEIFLILLWRDTAGVWILNKLILIPLFLSVVISLKKIIQGTEQISQGNIDYKIETKHLIPDFRIHAENINNISRGMTNAVEERLKSERMKTELITNVSHDIKTPLTSIISYSDLIGKENDPEKIKEYSEVIVRQSSRLKRLTDDVVEMTKASTGNMKLDMDDYDAAQFLLQAAGEYEDIMKNAGLEIVLDLKEQPLWICADSQKMWRVFDNLMNNISKYAQTNTRVYLSLFSKEDRVYMIFKNTSRQALNISAEELMERFVRGESSRNTEGNGLGLSIAKSLVELQEGEMHIDIDGDLFKTTLIFNRENKMTE